MSRKLIVELIGDTSNLDRALKRSSNNARKFSQEMTRGQRIAGFAKQGAAVAGFSLSIETAVGVMRDSIGAASNMNEMISKTDAVFGDSAQQVQAWAKTTTKAFGISERQALATASSFGALFAPIGIVGKQAADQSERLTQLGADLASFYDTSVQDALDAIRSGIVGESEPLRRYGVQLSEARVQAQALTDTHKKSAKQLTTQEKALARIELIYKDTTKAQGDFARTSGGAANQMRIAQANADNLKVALGNQLLPALTGVVTAFNDLVVAGGKVAKIKIPSIEIPFHITVGGQDIGGRLGGAAATAARQLPGIGPVLKLVDDLKRAGAKVGEEGSAAFAEGFADKFSAVAALTRGLKPAKFTGKLQPVGRNFTQQMNQWFDARITRMLDRAADKEGPQQIAALTRISALITKRIAATQDITRKLNLEDRLRAVNREKAAARAAMVQAFIDRLAFNVDLAGLTKSLNDDIAAARAWQAAVEKRIKIEGHTLDLDRQWLEATTRIRDLTQQRTDAAKEAAKAAKEHARQVAETARAARTARQFRALGLGPTGEDIVPGVENLRKRFADLRKRLAGTGIASRSVIRGIGRVLSGALGTVEKDVRSKIDEMFDSWADALKQGRDTFAKFKPIDATKFVRGLGLGLSPAQTRRLIGAVAGISRTGKLPPSRTAAFAGAGGVTIHNANFYGVQNMSQLENELHKRAKARPQTRRGAR